MLPGSFKKKAQIMQRRYTYNLKRKGRTKEDETDKFKSGKHKLTLNEFKLCILFLILHYVNTPMEYERFLQAPTGFEIPNPTK